MPNSKPPQISLEEALQKLERGESQFIDIRSPTYFKEGHIPGARLLDHQTLDSFLAEADIQKPLIVYCYKGISSQNAALYFETQGFANVYSLMEGFNGWRAKFPDKVEIPTKN